MNTPIRMIGLGSSHGDDAIAWAVVDRLRQSHSNASNYELCKIEGSQGILDRLDGTGSCVILDAAKGPEPVGTWLRFTWPDERIQALRAGTTHDLGLETVFRIAESLGTLPKTVVIYALFIQDVEPGHALSPRLAAAVPEIAQAIANDLMALDGSLQDHA